MSLFVTLNIFQPKCAAFSSFSPLLCKAVRATVVLKFKILKIWHNICNTPFYPQDVAIDIEIKEKLIRISNKDQVYKIAGTVLCQHLRRLYPHPMANSNHPGSNKPSTHRVIVLLHNTHSIAYVRTTCNRTCRKAFTHSLHPVSIRQRLNQHKGRVWQSKGVCSHTIKGHTKD